MTSPTEPLERVTRRRFLRWTLLGGAGALAAGAGLFSFLRRSPLDDQPVPVAIRHLSSAEYHLFARAVQALLPVDGRPLPPPASLPVLENVDHMLGLLTPTVRKDLQAGLMIFDHAALLSGWHGKRFVDLGDEEARTYLDDWAGGNMIQRALSTTVKKLVYASYWRQPETWGAMQFDGPVSDRWGLVSRGNTPMPESERRPS